ncbi:fluoride efflux transporter FluC [Schaalia vaccimaxillae]|uniref:fluoride efflux transporter FluC n=1 Tax=Schaalia vaccimaxillae TaxID=183916 RepID=UPI0003B7537F|nr:CrcB family protein [Schaalia vaccimaxillae]
MTSILWICVAIGGALGATCRWKLDTVAKRRTPDRPYLGIALINIIGSFAAGVAYHVVSDSDLATALITTGFLGGFTTFSTAVMDAWDLIESKRYATAAALLVGVWVVALVCAAMGMYVAAIFVFGSFQG